VVKHEELLKEIDLETCISKHPNPGKYCCNK